MLSMLDIYKKYSLPHNNLEVFCIGYGIRRGLATQKQVPHIILYAVLFGAELTGTVSFYFYLS